MNHLSHTELAELIEQAPWIIKVLDEADIPLVTGDGRDLSLTERIIVAAERARVASGLSFPGTYSGLLGE